MLMVVGAVLAVPVIGSLALVGPGGHVVLSGVRVETREQAVQVLGVLELLADQGGGVSVRLDILLEPQVVADHIVDQCAQQHDVGSGTDCDVLVGHGTSPGEARVNVDDLRAPGLGFSHPLVAHRVAFGHVRA